MERDLGAFWKYTFVYGAMNSYQCRFCGKDDYDKRNLRSLQTQSVIHGDREYLIAALESVMSYGLTVELGWSWRQYLNDNGIDYGCFGTGKALSAVFELVLPDE